MGARDRQSRIFCGSDPDPGAHKNLFIKGKPLVPTFCPADPIPILVRSRGDRSRAGSIPCRSLVGARGGRVKRRKAELAVASEYFKKHKCTLSTRWKRKWVKLGALVLETRFIQILYASGFKTEKNIV